MLETLQIAKDAYVNYANYLCTALSTPSWNNYLYWLIGISCAFFAFEIFRPWREDQKKFRKDFWLDAFYMFFNFFLFSLVIHKALSEVIVNWFSKFLALFGLENLVAFEVGSWPIWSQLLLLFIVRDFVHWNVHRLLHHVPWLWEFHKVHHSVEEMGFAAHLRFHWMENIIYRTLEYIPLAMIGFGIEEFFVVHIITTIVGHFNHSNLRVPLGPLKYIFNNPQMHIWHHAKKLPKDRLYGMNYGLTLSVWDYLFRTAYIPHDGRDIPLGFHDMEKFPKDFLGQSLHGLKRKSKDKPS